jgi:ubiquinone/menaquinone biosynthesis C-methylase UbiE
VKAYYHERAAEYDNWWLARGSWKGRVRPGWEEELAEVWRMLGGLPDGRTLDVACGTGFITQHLTGEVVGLDQSDAMLAIARERVPGGTFVQGDALELPFDDSSFDRVFASYFYCHLEEPERVRFLAEARRVAPELVIMASRRDDTTPPDGWEERVLENGSRWQVYKRYFTPEGLSSELGGRVLHAGRWFVVAGAP